MSKKKKSLFFENFIGEFVLIQTQEGSFGGYILDMDDDYYYIGQTAEQISTAIKIDSVVNVVITDPSVVFPEDYPNKDEMN